MKIPFNETVSPSALRRLDPVLCLAVIAAGLVGMPTPAPAAEQSGRHNVLSAAEKSAGWQLLFDGQSLNGWRGFRGTGIPEGRWKVEDGMIHALPAKHEANDRSADIITEKKFNNFEFSWSWRLAKKTNSGIKYFVTEARAKTPGPEYQMLDDINGKTDLASRLHQTASFYEILPPALDSPRRPAGEWNESRVVVRGSHVEHWLNGKNVLTYDLGSPEVKAGLAKSKFKDEPGFGDKIIGHLMLTHHGDECWFRDIKLLELK